VIRLPTSEEEEAHMGETFPEDDIEGLPHERNFHDEDDDIPPVVPSSRKVKVTENEEDFFDVSDDEEEEEEVVKPAAQDEGTKAWRD
jgi:hypothetical protein